MINSIYKKFKTYGLKTFLYFAWLELVKNLYWYPIRKSYGQNQEDLRIDELLGNKAKGFYVDVGAYDPDRFSNTKRFYNRGWRGINIEPDLNSYNKFQEMRPLDINLNIGIADSDTLLTFYKMDTQTLSTFDKQEAEEYKKQGYKVIEEKIIPVKKLSEVFEEHLPKGSEISFLTVDTEGFDMQVLQSNDWTKYKPQLICIESVKHSPKSDTEKSTNQELYLTDKGYKKVFDNGLNSIYLFHTS